MKTTQTTRPTNRELAADRARAERAGFDTSDWHPFSWTPDGHTPKIDTRTPADIRDAKAAGTL